MHKSYSRNHLRKGRCVEATKRPFFSLLGSRGQALSASGLGWVWTEADHLELNGYVAQENITTKTTMTKTTLPASSKPRATTATAETLPKTADNNWIAASVTLFLLGTVLLAAACRC